MLGASRKLTANKAIIALYVWEVCKTKRVVWLNVHNDENLSRRLAFVSNANERRQEEVQNRAFRAEPLT